MTEPVDYQTPLPPGCSLRYHDLPDGIRITRDSVPPWLRWLGLFAGALVVLLMPGFFFYCAWWLLNNFRTGPTQTVIIRGFLVVAIPLVSVRFIRDLWLNSGTVTEIAVTSSTLYWRKCTLLGGTREHFWPLSTVRFAKVDSFNRNLKVYRQRGKALSVFAFLRMAELEIAARRLNHAIGRNRSQQDPTLGVNF